VNKATALQQLSAEMPPRPEEPLAAATGGWDDERLLDPENVDDDLRCPICSSLCRDAVQCNSQHAFCAVCIHQWLERRQTCPLGNELLTVAALEQARFVRRLIDKLRVRCEFTPHGCAETPTIETIEAHERACGFRQVPCAHAGNGCSEVMCRHNISTHEAGCGFARTSCRRCGHELLRREHDAHYDGLACVQVLADGMRGLQQRLQEQKQEHEAQMQQMQERLQEQEQQTQQRLQEQEQQTQQRIWDCLRSLFGEFPTGKRLHEVERRLDVLEGRLPSLGSRSDVSAETGDRAAAAVRCFEVDVLLHGKMANDQWLMDVLQRRINEEPGPKIVLQPVDEAAGSRETPLWVIIGPFIGGKVENVVTSQYFQQLSQFAAARGKQFFVSHAFRCAA